MAKFSPCRYLHIETCEIESNRLIGFGASKTNLPKSKLPKLFTLINVFSFKLPFEVESRGFSFVLGCEVIVVYHLI
jgi:hypothetical protein